jgi:hypothetical protein
MSYLFWFAICLVVAAVNHTYSTSVKYSASRRNYVNSVGWLLDKLRAGPSSAANPRDHTSKGLRTCIISGNTVFSIGDFGGEDDATPITRRSGPSIIALAVKDILEERVAGKLAQMAFSYSWLGVFA